MLIEGMAALWLLILSIPLPQRYCNHLFTPNMAVLKPGIGCTVGHQHNRTRCVMVSSLQCSHRHLITSCVFDVQLTCNPGSPLGTAPVGPVDLGQLRKLNSSSSSPLSLFLCQAYTTHIVTHFSSKCSSFSISPPRYLYFLVTPSVPKHFFFH